MLSPTVTEFPVPTANSGLWDIETGPDGNLWFTEAGANKIGMIDPTTHAISELATPTANSFPRMITVGSDGNLWFTEGGTTLGSLNQIAMINPTTLRHHRVRHAHGRFLTPRHRGGPRRQSLVHRGRRQQDRHVQPCGPHV
ncbi:MAG: hypothetical protein U0790_05505 [Isosphaeraceae bacterium]